MIKRKIYFEKKKGNKKGVNILYTQLINEKKIDGFNLSIIKLLFWVNLIILEAHKLSPQHNLTS